MIDVEILKIKYSELKNVNFDDFKIKDGSRYFATMCEICGNFRGYQKPRFAKRLCSDCRRIKNVQRHVDQKNLFFINFNDTEIRNKQRFYRTKCFKCQKDRGYIEPKSFNRPCMSCSKTKTAYKHANINYNDFKKINGTMKYKMSCILCGADKGYKQKAYWNRRCYSCAKKYLSDIKTKITKNHKKVRHAFSVCISTRLKNRGSSKMGKNCFGVLGYSFEQLVNHLEKQFQPWMTWDNYGICKNNERTWQIDHIIPDSSFNYDNIYHEDFKKSWSLDNLRPLEAKLNISKGSKNLR